MSLDLSIMYLEYFVMESIIFWAYMWKELPNGKKLFIYPWFMDEISNTQQITLIKKIFVNLRMEQFLVKKKNYKKKKCN